MKHNRSAILAIAILTASWLHLSLRPAGGGLYSSVAGNLESSVDLRLIQRLDPYLEYIRYYASLPYLTVHRPVHPHFVSALILAESSGQPNAVSPKGAIGLGQLLFETAQKAAQEIATLKLDLKYVDNRHLTNLTRDGLFDPATNILITCYLLTKYNQQFDGRLDLIVSAWNAGPNRSALGKGKHVPFSETEALIGRINGYYLHLLQNPHD